MSREWRALSGRQGDMAVEVDPASGANLAQLSSKHLHLDWTVDFASKTIIGSVTHTLLAHAQVDYLVLDAKALTVSGVTDGSGAALKWRLEAAPLPCFGQRLTVELGRALGKGEEAKVTVAYSTSPVDCTALQWLPKEQTEGRHGPFLFSQCQAIHARTLMPCMDTPAVKATYGASVRVPRGLTALMSAVGKSGPEEAGEGRHSFTFEQRVPIPSYLLAVVVGVVERREVSPRVAVWAEPELVEAAAKEFCETEVQLQASEELLGPYVWGRYDILVLPPTFPYGGMENPCLTFATPTLIAGDRSLADVIQHEITHSWTGNLVTNATWDHFWLNEGFTTLCERKVTGKLKAAKAGAKFSAQAFRHASAIEGWRSLTYAVKEQFSEGHRHTRLLWDTAGTDPDEAFSTVPYEKGHTFLVYLEGLVGGPERFDPWLRSYVQRFKYQSITTEDWRRHFTAAFPDVDWGQVEWERWFTEPGMPIFTPPYDDALFAQSTGLAQRWLAGEVAVDGASEFAAYATNQKVDFLSQLLTAAAGALSGAQLEGLASAYGLSETRNCEVRFRWLRLALKQRFRPALPQALAFVTVQGRMKYTRPIYTDLRDWDEARPQAEKLFNEQRPNMHPLTASHVAKLFGPA